MCLALLVLAFLCAVARRNTVLRLLGSPAAPNATLSLGPFRAEKFVGRSELHELLDWRDKHIAVVGNAPISLAAWQRIDEADVVVRINKFPSVNSRCDIIVTRQLDTELKDHGGLFAGEHNHEKVVLVVDYREAQDREHSLALASRIARNCSRPVLFVGLAHARAAAHSLLTGRLHPMPEAKCGPSTGYLAALLFMEVAEQRGARLSIYGIGVGGSGMIPGFSDGHAYSLDAPTGCPPVSPDLCHNRKQENHVIEHLVTQQPFLEMHWA